ncbi:uncharacterized protein SETTUDRAFT_165064 [Exserohilum turcica Et28A]|uniref:Uncharacterized protein n=1 Tax=Exserohilum turcicum (strain 28A) TaxID=671987 RepID=R0JYM2_EXST2|nr:uncharacterized protein SETTUDRAFT_165064 [Exserohilum turcica Et28A]EOA82564.1 hypothetical protein SETTUDRAFT_165064 [Exserohilum turcica Et28A]
MRAQEGEQESKGKTGDAGPFLKAKFGQYGGVSVGENPGLLAECSVLIPIALPPRSRRVQRLGAAKTGKQEKTKKKKEKGGI